MFVATPQNLPERGRGRSIKHGQDLAESQAIAHRAGFPNGFKTTRRSISAQSTVANRPPLIQEA